MRKERKGRVHPKMWSKLNRHFLSFSNPSKNAIHTDLKDYKPYCKHHIKKASAV